MRTYFLSLLLPSCLLALAGCSEKTDVEPIRAHYTSEFPDKEINLAKKLDDRITLLSESKKDTLQLSILYNKVLKKTTIIDDTTKDTLFYGKVYKHRGLHYFCSKAKDSVYWISAVKIKRDMIQGLGTEYWQMYSIDELLDSNKNAALHQLVDKNKPGYAITPDKKIVSAFYESIIDSMPVLYRLQTSEEKIAKKPEKEDEIISNTETSDTLALPIIHRYYPNPVKDVLHLETNVESEYELMLTDVKGDVILKESFSGFRKSLKLQNILPEIYLLQINSNELERRETVKILVQ